MYWFIINRSAGNGKALKVWKTIEPLLRQKQVSYCSEFPNSKQETSVIVRKILSRSTQTAIVGVGGDGTVQSIIHEMAKLRTDVPFALIPAGTGNDFANALGLPLDPSEALDCLLRGKICTIDVGYAGRRYFATVLGAGFDGAVAKMAGRAWYKKLANKLRIGKCLYHRSFCAAVLLPPDPHSDSA